MRQPINWSESRVSLRPTVLVVGGIAGSFLMLHTLLTHNHAPLIRAVVRADLDVLLFLNGFARRSWWFDVLVREFALASNLFFQGLMVALFWGTWFAPGDPLSTRRKRESMLSSLFGVYATAVLAIILRA